MFVLGQWKMGGDNPPIFKLVQIGAREGNWGGCDYKGQVVTLKTKRFYPGPNHRRGIYVSYTKRWDKIRPHLTKPTAIAYYDEFRSGKKREDVDITMIERRGGKALD
jgi:hypothetical protein